MLAATISLCCGLLFGVGLALSGMTDTQVVLGFLDITGEWQPDLAFVMGGALAVTIPCFALLKKRAAPVCDSVFHVPENCRIEARPLLGSAIFGIGWGLYGYCPGPALASLTTLNWQPLLFVAAMSVGMLIEKGLHKQLPPTTHPGQHGKA